MGQLEATPPGAPGLAGFETWDCCRRHKCGVRSITARCNLYFYPAHMPLGLERWHGGHDLHFITFSCYDRQPLLATAQRRDLFLEVLERVRRRYRWVVLAYVVMPEHVHLLVSEPAERPLSTAMQALKLGFARRVIGERRRLRPGLENRETLRQAPGKLRGTRKGSTMVV